MAKARERASRNYGVTLGAIAFGDVKIKLHFDDIIETEDGWEPKEKKERKTNRCEKFYARNSTMDLRKGLRLYR